MLRALDMLPSGGGNLHYFLQRNITRSLPRPIQQIPKGRPVIVAISKRFAAEESN